MRDPAQLLNPSQAAARLGISVKALRLYERRGLLAPPRSAAGWRIYGPADMARAREIVTLRGFGLSLARIARVLDGGDPGALAQALAAHQAALEQQIRQIAGTVETLRGLCAEIAAGHTPAIGTLAGLAQQPVAATVAFDLPWPWGGERFELSDVRPLNYIIGPLGSGKTRLAHALAGALPDATFIGPDRRSGAGDIARRRAEKDQVLAARVQETLDWLVEDGATPCQALTDLVVVLVAADAAVLVIDMVEQDLDRASQEALAAWLRNRGADRPLFVLTRSSSILDLAAVTPDEAILFCPPNHSPPYRVSPYPGAPGYEAVASCLASPEVRARTAGVIAWRPQTA